ncbi:MAG: hypothetical protein HXY34_00620 [Candidatus Thorarchaeota archaeon]|nr:hypothetical protein [Candidatus Thorarchaeota archaeon]
MDETIVFSCPECKSKAVVRLSETEAAKIKEEISTKGRSPTLIVKCEKDHELLVTLYNSPSGLGIRDVVVPVRSDSKKKGSEVDWLKQAFGG